MNRDKCWKPGTHWALGKWFHPCHKGGARDVFSHMHPQLGLCSDTELASSSDASGSVPGNAFKVTLANESINL